MTDLEKELFNTLFAKYGSMLVTKKEASEIIGRSRASMDADRYVGKGINYYQEGDNGNVKYSLHDLVNYLVNGAVKTA